MQTSKDRVDAIFVYASELIRGGHEWFSCLAISRGYMDGPCNTPDYKLLTERREAYQSKFREHWWWNIQSKPDWLDPEFNRQARNARIDALLSMKETE
jgi:hypothetical protein